MILRYITIVYIILSFIGCVNNDNKALLESSNTLTTDCKIFLEDYENEIFQLIEVQKEIKSKGDNINLIISRNSIEESISNMQSAPSFFSCISNIYFKTKIDSLNSAVEF